MWKIPNLDSLPRSSAVVGIDTETYDPNLIDDGPGWGRGWGHILGVSLAYDNGQKAYLPINHKDGSLPLDEVKCYLTRLLDGNIKVGANLIYDLGWLSTIDVFPSGMWYDVLFAEALLEPNSIRFDLDSLAKKYLGQQKQSNELYEYLAKTCGGKPDGKQRANLYKAPLELVGPYAEQDAALPVNILVKQDALLSTYGLSGVFSLESKLIPLLVKMRLRGVPVDLLKAQEAREDLILAEEIMTSQLVDVAGFPINVNSGKDLEKFFTKEKVKFNRTEKGNPSFTADWLNEQVHPSAKLVNDIRKAKKARSTFIENAILEKAVDGKIYPSLHPLRSDDGGTITGRFSSSKPNSQQLPARDEIMAPMIRGIFIPEEGHSHWLKADYSQIEYRMFAHYSNDSTLQSEYSKPGTDYHDIVGQMLGGKIPRKLVKNYNFATIYGAGEKRLAQMLANMLTVEEAYALLENM